MKKSGRRRAVQAGRNSRCKGPGEARHSLALRKVSPPEVQRLGCDEEDVDRLWRTVF